MALRFCDSFDHYATADIPYKYTANNSAVIGASTGRTGAALGLHGNSAFYVSQALDNQEMLIVGFAFKTTQIFNVGTLTLINFLDGASNQVDLRITSGTGVWLLTRNGTTLASGGAATANTWMYLELKVVFHGSAGSYDFRVNGTSVFAASSVNTSATGNAYASVIKISCTTDGNTYVDDLYMLDGTGSRNNDFLGDVTVKAIFPDGAGNYSQWTPSAGSNYQCVDESSKNDDTDYVSTTTAANKDSYTFGAVGLSGGVYGIQNVMATRKNSLGSQTVRRLIRINGTNYVGATFTPDDVAYLFNVERLETSPESSTNWGIGEIDGAEFGIELVS